MTRAQAGPFLVAMAAMTVREHNAAFDQTPIMALPVEKIGSHCESGPEIEAQVGLVSEEMEMLASSFYAIAVSGQLSSLRRERTDQPN